MRASEWLVELECHSGSAVETLRFSSHGYVSWASDTPANTVYEARITSIGSFAVHMFGEGKTMGGETVTMSDITISNVDDALSKYIDYGFDGRPVILRRLTDPSGSLADAEVVLKGTLEGMDSDSGMTAFRFRFYDRRRDIDKPIQDDFLAGTITGTSASIDGTADQKDKPRPLCYGKCFSVPGVLVNPYDLLIQVHDGPVHSITAYDGGIALINAGDYATISALRSATQNPGKYATCLAEGVWRPFGSFKGRPGFVWTADVVEGATEADRYPGAVTKRMLAKLGQDDSIDEDSFEALDADADVEIGIYIEDETSGLAAIQQVLSSVGGWIAPDSDGNFVVGPMLAPGASAWLLIEPEILTESATDTIALTPNPDTDGNVPTNKVTLNHSRNWHVFSDTEIAGSVASNNAARATALQQEYVNASDEDEDVLTKHLLAKELTIETLLTDADDAAAEATRRLALYGTERKVIRVMATREDAEDAVLNSTGMVKFHGLGFDDGKLMVVIGREDDFQNERVILTLWG
jgi:hypothetical protein